MPTSFIVPPLQLRRSGLVLLLVLGLIAALTVFFVREAVELRRIMQELRVNDRTRIEIRNVLVHLLEAETGQRGYLITGDDNYLSPYLAGRSKIRDSLRKAEVSGYSDATFMADIRDLKLVVDAKMKELERTVSLKQQGNDVEALIVVRQGHGRETMLEARRIIQAQLDILRSSRDQNMERFDERVVYAAVILTTILSVVVLLSSYVWRSVSNAARANNEMAKRLAQEASHDALTNLPNRRFFDRWTQRLVNRNAREYKPFSLLLIDLDGFKKVNDRFGHIIGDEVLKEAAARMQAALQGNEFLTRLGGDEFGLVIERDVSKAEAKQIALRLIESLAPSLHPNLVDGEVAACVGIAAFPSNGRDLPSLIEAADAALYESKDQGRGVVTFSSRVPSKRDLAHQVSMSMRTPGTNSSTQ